MKYGLCVYWHRSSYTNIYRAYAHRPARICMAQRTHIYINNSDNNINNINNNNNKIKVYI